MGLLAATIQAQSQPQAQAPAQTDENADDHADVRSLLIAAHSPAGVVVADV